MLWKCCTQYASKFGKLSSGHRTGKGQFSFQSQRKTMLKNPQLLLLLLLLLLSRFSCVRLCVTPEMATHQIPPSLGFSRQDHWSGLPFPSFMHCMKVKSEKWKWSCSVMSDSLWPHGLQSTRLLRPWDFPGKSTGVGCHCLLWRMLKLPHNCTHLTC